MTRQPSGHKHARLAAITRSARGLKTAGKLPFSRSEAVKLYFADVAEDDLSDRDPSSLAAAALSHLSWALDRKPDEDAPAALR